MAFRYPAALLMGASLVIVGGVPDAFAQDQNRIGGSRYNGGAASADSGSARYGTPAAGSATAATPASRPATPSQPTAPAPSTSTTGNGLTPVGGSGPTRARVSKGSGTLPNDHGQMWREYDIRPYTLRVQNNEHPEQRIVDWILRETGYEAWHTSPLGVLSATRETLRVYHTPEMHQVVTDIVDRFVNSQAKNRAFSLRIATVRSPNWRAKALPLMTPISAQSPGLQAWIMPKENAAILLGELTKRNDFREHTASNQLVLNGNAVTLSTLRPRTYIKGVVRTPNAWPGFQPQTGSLEEGALLEFSPLLSLDTATADAVVKIRIHQVEKMTPVTLDIPTTTAGNQRMQVEVPQLTQSQIHERFRWPADQVLLLSLGVVPPPTATSGGSPFRNLLPGGNQPPRADGLLVIDVKGTAIPGATQGAAPLSTALQPGAFSGRY